MGTDLGSGPGFTPIRESRSGVRTRDSRGWKPSASLKGNPRTLGVPHVAPTPRAGLGIVRDAASSLDPSRKATAKEVRLPSCKRWCAGAVAVSAETMRIAVRGEPP